MGQKTIHWNFFASALTKIKEEAKPHEEPTANAFAKGDRVVVSDAYHYEGYRGRHGVIEDVNSFTMRPILGMGPSTTT